MRRRIAAGLLAGALLAVPMVAQEASPIRDQDRSIYNTLFSEKLSTVERTRSPADDAILAQEMMIFAENLPDADRGVRCLIYAEVVGLSSNAADLGLMKQAMSLLNANWPKQDVVTPEQLMQFANRAYKSVERNDREVQGEHYIDMLLDLADRYEAAKDPEQAIGVCRLASTIAKTIGSIQVDPIQAKIDRLDKASDIAKRIKMLQLSVERSPQNSPAARELIKLLIVQQNDPQTAAQYVASTKDEELIDLVQHCAQGVDQATAASAMRVGDWYVALAEEEQKQLALSLLQESRRWYEQFFALYRRDDALAKRVEEMDNLVLLRIERLVADNPELASLANDGWAPLIAAPYDAAKHVFREANVLHTDGNGVTLENGVIYVPYKPGKAYEVRVTLTINKDAPNPEKSAMNVHLPITGNRVLSTRYHLDNEQIAYVDKVTETAFIKPAPGKIGVRQQLTFQIAETPGQLAYALLYNGKAAVKWQGSTDTLEEVSAELLEALPEGIGSVMLISCEGNVTLHAVDYKSQD